MIVPIAWAQSANPAQDGAQAGTPLQTGNITGTVVDKDGATVPNANISLAANPSPTTPPPATETVSDGSGQYAFTNVAPGQFELTVSASGFATQKFSGTLQPGQGYIVPDMKLVVAAEVVLQVTETTEEIAAEQIQIQEKQRLFGVVPNFYVSYIPNAAPLTSRQKFQLAWKSTIDPVSFGVVALTAGIEQGVGAFSGYGPGAAGYGKRFGANLADSVTGTFIGGAILPSLLKQDPRYFYKGTGSRRSRLFYAVANAVICKGDNGRWQANYSSILGGLAAGGISNLYYPASNQRGAALSFENAGVGIGESAISNVVQEFLLRHITPHAAGPPVRGN